MVALNQLPMLECAEFLEGESAPIMLGLSVEVVPIKREPRFRPCHGVFLFRGFPVGPPDSPLAFRSAMVSGLGGSWRKLGPSSGFVKSAG